MASPASAHSLPGHTNGAELPSASPCSTLRHLTRLLLGPVPRAPFVLPGASRCLCLCGVPWHRLLEVRRQQAMSVPPGAPGPAPCTRSVPTSPRPPCRMSSAFVWLGMPSKIPVCHSELGAGTAPTWLRNPNKLSRLGTRAGTSSVLTLNSYWCDSLAIYLFKATELFAILLKSKHSVWAGELFCLNVRLGDTDDNLSE